MSNQSELEAELTVKIAQYRAALTLPNSAVGGRNFDHDGKRKALLGEITDLRKLIILEGGPQVIRTQVFG